MRKAILAQLLNRLSRLRIEGDFRDWRLVNYTVPA
jgi:hypothetical protein